MASNLECVGLAVGDNDALDSLVWRVIPDARIIGRVDGTDIFRWEDPSGARLMVGLRHGGIVDFLPSFAARPGALLGPIRFVSDELASAAVVDEAGAQATQVMVELEERLLLRARGQPTSGVLEFTDQLGSDGHRVIHSEWCSWWARSRCQTPVGRGSGPCSVVPASTPSVYNTTRIQAEAEAEAMSIRMGRLQTAASVLLFSLIPGFCWAAVIVDWGDPTLAPVVLLAVLFSGAPLLMVLVCWRLGVHVDEAGITIQDGVRGKRHVTWDEVEDFRVGCAWTATSRTCGLVAAAVAPRRDRTARAQLVMRS